MNSCNPDSNEDDVWGSWEEMEDSGALDERLEKELKSHQVTVDKDRQSQAPIVIQDDSMRTAYQPRLKILKRPMEAGGEMNGDQESTQAAAKTKTLAEREAAYAEARRRIMGSATSENPSKSNDLRQGTTVVKPSKCHPGSESEGQAGVAKGKR